MRDVVFAWLDHEGNLRLTTPMWSNQKPHETEEQFLQRVAGKLPNPVALHPARDLPKDRASRNSWKLKDGKIVIEP